MRSGNARPLPGNNALCAHLAQPQKHLRPAQFWSGGVVESVHFEFSATDSSNPNCTNRCLDFFQIGNSDFYFGFAFILRRHASQFQFRHRIMNAKRAPVAQLDRANDFESLGREFEPLRARQMQLAISGPQPRASLPEGCSRHPVPNTRNPIAGTPTYTVTSWSF